MFGRTQGFTFKDGPPRVADRSGRSLTVTGPGRVDVRLPHREYSAKLTFTEWRRSEGSTLVITYSMYPGVPRDHQHSISEGLALLFESQSEIAQRFDRVEVHTMPGIGPYVVMSAIPPGMGTEVDQYVARQREQNWARIRELNQGGN